MKLFLVIFTLMCVKATQAQIKHHDMVGIACSDTDKEFVMGVDAEEVFYADFVKKQIVNMMPAFAPLGIAEGAYQAAEGQMAVCINNIGVFRTELKDEPVTPDAPQNSIYPRDDVTLGLQNTLICHSVRFFPPTLRVRWTKNGDDVTESSSLSQYYPNDDNTYNQFSHLHFTPQEGDIYTCIVEHEALDTPDTKTWEVDVELPSVGPAVFCGVGLAVGLLGVATGTFFLVKGNQCN